MNRNNHDDVMKWKQFPRYWPFVRGIHRSPVNSPHKGQWRGALVFTVVCARINGWVNNREAGDLRRHRAHYDVIVMYLDSPYTGSPWGACDVHTSVNRVIIGPDNGLSPVRHQTITSTNADLLPIENFNNRKAKLSINEMQYRLPKINHVFHPSVRQWGNVCHGISS